MKTGDEDNKTTHRRRNTAPTITLAKHKPLLYPADIPRKTTRRYHYHIYRQLNTLFSDLTGAEFRRRGRLVKVVRVPTAEGRKESIRKR